MVLAGGKAPVGGRRQKPGGRRLFGALCALTLLFLGRAAGAADVLILQSNRIAAYDEAAEAFEQTLAANPSSSGPKQAERHRVTTLALSDPGAEAELARRLRYRPPDLVLAVGAAALSSLRDVPDLPTVHLLVPHPGPLLAGRRRTVGVAMDVPPAASLDALLKVAPRMRRLGVVHDPRRTGSLVAEALEAARHRGVTVVAEEARSASEAPGLIAALRERVDAFWMLPDLTVTTPETVEALLLAALSRGLPVVTFSEKYLSQGATVAVTFESSAMGEKAAELAVALLAGAPASSATAKANRFRVRVNATTARKLGLTLGKTDP